MKLRFKLLYVIMTSIMFLTTIALGEDLKKKNSYAKDLNKKAEITIR